MKTSSVSYAFAFAGLLTLPGTASGQDSLLNGKPLIPVPSDQPEIRIVGRSRPLCPIRLGGVFTMGLGEKSDPFEDSAALGVPLSNPNRRWLVENCDVVALNAVNITRDTFPAMVKANTLFTPLIFAYASTLSEKPTTRGSLGGWNPALASLTLRDSQGKEIAHPDKNAHWMDFGSKAWGAHWKAQALKATRYYGAQGVVAAELPLGNTFVGEDLARYKSMTDRANATESWLRAARAAGQFLMVPSAIGFDALIGRATLPTPPGTEEPELSGRFWDHYYSLTDGAWAEGWIHPYWSEAPLPENIWELHLEAADRAARNGQVFIACGAYRDDAELEFLLASYLLVAHKQGRFVFQPMPLRPDARPDAGFSLTVFKKEVEAKAAYFQAPLGAALQERHLVQAEIDPNEPLNLQSRTVWRRAFQGGAVYVNTDPRRIATVFLGGQMKRPSGQMVTKVELPPRSGAILLYTKKPR